MIPRVSGRAGLSGRALPATPPDSSNRAYVKRIHRRARAEAYTYGLISPVHIWFVRLAPWGPPFTAPCTTPRAAWALAARLLKAMRLERVSPERQLKLYNQNENRKDN